MSKILAVLMLAAMLVLSGNAGAELSNEEAIARAKKAVEEKGIVLEQVEIIYDEDNDKWEERVEYIEENEADPNHGVLPHGILKNKEYQAVLFDFVEGAPTKDVWVFIDEDTGDILTIYQEK